MYTASYSNKTTHEVYGPYIEAHEARMILREKVKKCVYHRLYDKLNYDMLDDNNKKIIKKMLHEKITNDQQSSYRISLFLYKCNPFGEDVNGTVNRYIETNLWKTLIPKEKALQYFTDNDYNTEADIIIEYGCCGTVYKITELQ